VRTYAQDLKTFWVFLEARGLCWDRVTLQQVGEFTGWLRRPADNVIVLASGSPRRSARTVNRMPAALFRLYEFHARHGVGVARALVDAARSGRGGYNQFRGGCLEAWIWRIALSCALDGRRSAWRLRLNGVAVLPDPQVVDPARDPELAAAVRALAPRRRLMVFLRYYADLSYAEIAEACGVSEGTVAAALAQARAALADALDLKEVSR
jgi:RNA polymerase sigma factor (sigma-70 family)